MAISGGGLLYSDPDGKVTKYGHNVAWRERHP